MANDGQPRSAPVGTLKTLLASALRLTDANLALVLLVFVLDAALYEGILHFVALSVPDPLPDQLSDLPDKAKAAISAMAVLIVLGEVVLDVVMLRWLTRCLPGTSELGAAVGARNRHRGALFARLALLNLLAAFLKSRDVRLQHERQKGFCRVEHGVAQRPRAHPAEAHRHDNGCAGGGELVSVFRRLQAGGHAHRQSRNQRVHRGGIVRRMSDLHDVAAGAGPHDDGTCRSRRNQTTFQTGRGMGRARVAAR